MSYDRGPVQSLVRLLEVFALTDESAVRAQTLETVAESFDSEAAGIVCDDTIIESIGFGADASPLLAVATAGLGAGHMLVPSSGSRLHLDAPTRGPGIGPFRAAPYQRSLHQRGVGSHSGDGTDDATGGSNGECLPRGTPHDRRVGAAGQGQLAAGGSPTRASPFPHGAHPGHSAGGDECID